MRGKAGLVVGLAIGYVLGTRAGRERYEQIKAAALRLWNLDPVQQQVEKAKQLGASAALAVPTAVWNGAVKATQAVRTQGARGQKPDVGAVAGEETGRAAAETPAGS